MTGIRTIGVIGAGQMGNGIAHVCAVAGYDVKITDVSQDAIDRGLKTIGNNLDRQIAKKLITPEQKAEHLPKILSGEVNWRQGYSEPGSGSDLASLQTRAVKDGDEYVINGQKIWTSGAHTADWLFALVRTDPEAPKHRGISFLMMDIHTPGLNVRPLINMAWQHGFNETFFEDVRVPVANRVGEENRGWYVNAQTMDYERSGGAHIGSSRRLVDNALEWVRAHPTVPVKPADRLDASAGSTQLNPPGGNPEPAT